LGVERVVAVVAVVEEEVERGVLALLRGGVK